MRQAGADEIAEQRMRARQAALQFGMELHRKIPGMVLEFDDFDEIAFGPDAG